MTGLVDDVRRRVDKRCVVEGFLRKETCKPPLKGTPGKRLIVHCESPGFPLRPDQKRCDYMVVAEPENGPGWVAALELKGGKLKMDALEQLRESAAAIAGLVEMKFAVDFRPVIAFEKAPHRRDYIALQRATVRFRGGKEPVRMIKCSDPLAKAFAD